MVNLKEKEQLPSVTEVGPVIASAEKKAARHLKFTLSHLLVSPGKTVVVTACGTGRLAYEYALLRPHLNFIGMDRKAEKIDRAQKFFSLDNLSFIKGGVDDLLTENFSVDAILNIGSLHRLYSRTGYNLTRVIDVVKKQLEALSIGGQIIIQDYFTPANKDQMVFLELPKVKGESHALSERSPAEWLIDFSQTARPLDTSGAQGFLLEEEAPYRVGTQLFRLPLKWALEFQYQINDIDNWDQNLSQEYTMFSIDEWHKYINAMGGRITYSTPYYQEGVSGDQEYMLYNEKGEPMELPPRGFVCVIEKIRPTDPVYIQEQRCALSEKVNMAVETMIDDKTADEVDLVKCHNLTDDLLLWRIDDQGNILVTVRSNVPRPVMNAAPRGVPNLDNKRWAGYMTEPLVMPVEETFEQQKQTVGEIAQEFLGIDPMMVQDFRLETQYYPKPEFLIQRLRGFTARIPGHVSMQLSAQTHHEFNNGMIKEYNAQDILQAIHTGLIPDSRLEILIMHLLRRVHRAQIKGDNLDEFWEDIPETDINEKDLLDEKDLQKISDDPDSFLTAEHVNSSLKHIRSVFVKQGHIGGVLTGIETVEEEFVFPFDTTTNTVVCFPLSLDSAKGLKVVGVEPKKIPVPNRIDDESALLQLPSFHLSNEIKTFYQLREFLSKKFDCDIKNVRPMGSSFFACPEISPERVYPFAIFNPGKGSNIILKNAPMEIIGMISKMTKPHGKSAGAMLFRGMKDLGEWYQGGLNHDLKTGVDDIFVHKKILPEIKNSKVENSYEPK